MDERPDGRRARRAQNRGAVVDAMIALHAEGVLAPTLDQVCARAGVSERSLFRYFESLDELRAAVVARAFETASPSFSAVDPPTLDLDERISRIVRARIAMCEALGGVSHVARARELDTPEIAGHLAVSRARLRAQVAQQFAPELASLKRPAAQRRVALIASVLSFASFDLLTRVHGSSRRELRRSWTEALVALLGCNGHPAARSRRSAQPRVRRP